MKSFEIFFTSDTHGKVMPVDYATGMKKDCGLLNIARDIKKRKNEVKVEKEILVMDGGDSLQGTPLITNYLENPQKFSCHPVAEAFNAMGLDFYTLGNHDFNFGYNVIRDYVNAMNATLLIANVEDLRGEIRHKRFVICTLPNGLRLGITGVVTDYVNVWEQPENLTELRVKDAFESASNVYKEMKEAGCDITILIYHGGYEEDLKTGRSLTDSRENIACEMCRKLDYDLMLTGHQHMSVPGLDLYGTWSVQPSANAEEFISLKAEYSEDGKISFSSKLLKTGSETDEVAQEKIMPLEESTEKWLDETVGEFDKEIEPENKLEIALHGSKVAALFNQVQLESVECDFSCTSLGNGEIGFKKSVSIRDIYAAYTFANTSVVKEVTVDILKEALERCAQYLELDEEGKPYISDVFMKPKIEHYNYDFYAGLDYAFDLRKPVGSRVVRLRKLDGTPLKEGETYRLVTSNYRATGTGGYEMIGNAKAVYEDPDNVQDLLVEYIRKHPKLTVPDNYRFEVIY
ncbi:2',3'-cyclic-nucleotide 2'-phosphodiesterase / 3'-nucleotidase [Oribacterium sp. KHPX15]|uniref:bifunctional metallophosphatase/5'-nucleotidase n=1 Tax=Oribacterium sp. KHPX15 TaxID=1855342 RepID=UPI00089A764A|nr:bifunctional UDP-sugar hydrolase/5'-nucleotidase [Oribacterium sp. KHPX15]SEA46255.1 2',3'-cyclic-nucleotide 2'-phosphodiesterase / 3'-nucleotidase [Oribacterium sp. KHPX15]